MCTAYKSPIIATPFLLIDLPFPPQFSSRTSSTLPLLLTSRSKVERRSLPKCATSKKRKEQKRKIPDIRDEKKEKSQCLRFIEKKKNRAEIDDLNTFFFVGAFFTYVHFFLSVGFGMLAE
ncbi:hypothetical protein FRC18_009653 [Serendipita sp. 400]|nr:hypothetical protein FRC18_009653 [Serendipita sp. 400]